MGCFASIWDVESWKEHHSYHDDEKEQTKFKILTGFDLSEISGCRAIKHPEIQRNEGSPKVEYELPHSVRRGGAETA